MDKPLCRLCHHRHGLGEDHVWREASASAPVATEAVTHSGVVPNKPVPNVVVPNSAVPNASNSDPVPNSNDAARVAKWKAANQERYRSYMRDLMRERRASPSSAAA